MSDAKIRFLLSPELSDGEHVSVLNTPEQVAEAVKLWAEECSQNFGGESCSITTKTMTDAEVEALPEV